MIVVDSSVWIANLRGDDSPQVRALLEGDTGQLVVGDLIALEVLRGLRSEREAAVQERRFRMIGIVPMVSVELAVSAARYHRRLRALGLTIRNSVDLVIATYCIEQKHSLLHSDRDFDPFERHLGLQVYRP